MYLRALADSIRRDLDRKVVLLAGPRQAGKTTLARALFPESEYLNFDYPEHRQAIQQGAWNREVPLLILDELHKKPNWKRWLKGIYDVEGVRPRIIVTGSARLDVTRRAGDSLAGRYFMYRLFPLDHAELSGQLSVDEVHRTLKACGGFPEPFSGGTAREYARWHRTHMDVILRQDLLDLEAVRDIVGVQTLVELLREQVGSPVSYASLSRALERDPKTVKHWIGILENLYVIFSVSPLTRSIARAIRKEPKLYFYDVGVLHDRPAAQLENIVALSLKKELARLEDVEGLSANLRYLRTIDGKELDFHVEIEGRPQVIIEVKTSDSAPAPSFRHFSAALPDARGVQLVENLEREHSYASGLEIRNLANWLTHLQANLVQK